MGNATSLLKKKTAGFSSIEIMIVVCMIGTLSCIAIPVFLGQKDKVIVGVTRANMETMRSGLSQYAAGNDINHYTSGSFNYLDFRTVVPESNLQLLEAEAKIVSGSFLYSNAGTSYYLQATSTNRTAVEFTASPRGVIAQ